MEKSIPGYSKYTVDEKGTIRNVVSKGIVKPEIGRRSNEFRVTIKNDSWKLVSPKVSRLVLMAFHPVPEFDYDWISALYRNGVLSNFNLDNLVWDFLGYTPPIDALNPINSNVFVRIPGFYRYEITPSGILRNASTKDILTPGISSVGYPCVRVVDDFAKSTYVGVHHLMARALLEHPIDVDQLVVNHRNGVKTDNLISNLEWTSYSGNISHAYYSGLREEVIPVYAKNAISGELKTFDSLNSAARFFDNSNPGKIHWWLHNGSKNKIREGWFVSLTNDWT